MRKEVGEKITPAIEGRLDAISRQIIVGDEILVYRKSTLGGSHLWRTDSDGQPILDQRHDYYLGITAGTKVEAIKAGKPIFYKFETERYAHRWAASDGSSTRPFEDALVVRRIDDIWFGKEEIEAWASFSASNQVILRELRARLGIPYTGSLEKVSRGFDSLTEYLDNLRANGLPVDKKFDPNCNTPAVVLVQFPLPPESITAATGLLPHKQAFDKEVRPILD